MGKHETVRTDHQSEALILAGLCRKDEILYAAIDTLQPESFDNEDHRTIFLAACEIAASSGKVSPLAVEKKLERMEQGRSALTAARQIFITKIFDRDWRAAIDSVRECALRRGLTRIGERMVFSASDPLVDPIEVLSDAERGIINVAGSGDTNAPSDMKEVARDFIAHLGDLNEGKADALGLQSGLIALDQVTGGFHRKDLHLIAARPSMGKTSLATTIAYNVSRMGKKVAFFSLEMSKRQLAVHIYAKAANVPSDELTGKVKPSQATWQAVSRASAKVTTYPLTIDDTAGLTPLSLRAKCHQIRQRQGIDVVIVDYLQLMRFPRIDNRERQISEISQSLKELAKDFDIPVIALSQLNRSSESRSDKRPALSDLRESGSLEQDASCVILCHRPEYYGITVDEDNMPTEGRGWLIVAKNRMGGVGDARLRFDGSRMAWQDESFRDEDGFNIAPPKHYIEDEPF